jgi:hypothetical protein
MRQTTRLKCFRKNIPESVRIKFAAPSRARETQPRLRLIAGTSSIAREACSAIASVRRTRASRHSSEACVLSVGPSPRASFSFGANPAFTRVCPRARVADEPARASVVNVAIANLNTPQRQRVPRPCARSLTHPPAAAFTAATSAATRTASEKSDGASSVQLCAVFATVR